MTAEAIFKPYTFGPNERAAMDKDGHILLPGILTDATCQRLVQSLAYINTLVHDGGTPMVPMRMARMLRRKETALSKTYMKVVDRYPPAARVAGILNPLPNQNAAEYDSYLASLIGHPQMLNLAHTILGDNIRFDHCVTLNRAGGNRGIRWHSHEYADDDPRLGFVRIFFYVNGFQPGDGNLKVVPGSHLFRDSDIDAHSDDELMAQWMADKVHPRTGEPLQIVDLAAPPATVALMWTHAAHAVCPRQDASDTRWSVVYAYRNPGQPSRARWITEEFARKAIPGAEGLMSLY